MQNTHNVVATGNQKVSILVCLQFCQLNNHHHFAQWPGRLFKVSSPTQWQVVITDPTHLDDLRKAPEHILSANRVVEEVRWSVLCDIITLRTILSNSPYNRNSLLIAM